MQTARSSEGTSPSFSSRALTWPATAALMAAMFIVSVGYGITLPILPFFIERFVPAPDSAALSRHTGMLTGVYALAIFLCAPLWGRYSDQHGRRFLLLTGLVGFAFTLTLFALVDNLPLVYVGRFFSGVFAAGVTPLTYALISDYAPTKAWRARRFAFLNVAAIGGFLVGPTVGGLALLVTRQLSSTVADIGYLAPLSMTSILALVIGFLVWTFVPGARPLQGEPTSSALRDRSRTVIIRLLLVSFVTALAIGAFEVGLSLRGKQILNLNAYQIGMLFAECSLVMFAVQAAIFSPLVKPEVTRHFVAPSLAVLAISLAALPFAGGYFMTTVAVALVAGSAGILSPIATYWISLNAGETQGRELGRQTSAASLGQAIGSAAGGLLAGVSLVPNAPFTVTGIFVVLGFSASIGLASLLGKLLEQS